MMRLLLSVFSFLLLAACQQHTQPSAESIAQSAVAVKSDTVQLNTQSLSSEPLSSRLDTAQPSVQSAFTNKQSHVWVTGQGHVVKLLADDNHPPRHQRFLVQVDTHQTLLMAHNIDIAPYVDDLQSGDTIGFSGEYIYNPKGGIVHWTHHDPQHQSASGWIEHNGKKYE